MLPIPANIFQILNKSALCGIYVLSSESQIQSHGRQRHFESNSIGRCELLNTSTVKKVFCLI